MPRLLFLAALVSVAALSLVVTGCDSGPETCADGELDSQDVIVGTGSEVATVSSTVILSYVGTLPDGEEFDSGQNVRFGLQGTIPGFRLGVAGMRAGGRRTITIPPTLGYGPNALPSIPACSTLIFDVRLLDIVS